jgi:hypothetical protein
MSIPPPNNFLEKRLQQNNVLLRARNFIFWHFLNFVIDAFKISAWRMYFHQLF